MAYMAPNSKKGSTKSGSGDHYLSLSDNRMPKKGGGQYIIAIKMVNWKMHAPDVDSTLSHSRN